MLTIVLSDGVYNITPSVQININSEGSDDIVFSLLNETHSLKNTSAVEAMTLIQSLDYVHSDLSELEREKEIRKGLEAKGWI